MSEFMVSGIELMLIGMGTVFVFLTLLVWATSLMSRLIMRFEPAKPTPAVPVAAPKPADQPDAELVAVLAAAVKAHRARRNRH